MKGGRTIDNRGDVRTLNQLFEIFIITFMLAFLALFVRIKVYGVDYSRIFSSNGKVQEINQVHDYGINGVHMDDEITVQSVNEQ